MNWNHIFTFLIGLTIGVMISIIIIKLYFFKYLKTNQTFNYNLEENQNILKTYQKELTDYFNNSLKLLNNIESNYRRLYQDTIYISNKIMSDQYYNNYVFQHNMTELEVHNDQVPKEIKFNNR